MSERVGNVAILQPEAPTECESCGEIAETRPYGPGGKRICFACGMKDEEGTARRMGQVLFGDGDVPVAQCVLLSPGEGEKP